MREGDNQLERGQWEITKVREVNGNAQGERVVKGNNQGESSTEVTYSELLV